MKLMTAEKQILVTVAGGLITAAILAAFQKKPPTTVTNQSTIDNSEADTSWWPWDLNIFN